MFYFDTESFVHDDNDDNILLCMKHSQKNNTQVEHNNDDSNDSLSTIPTSTQKEDNTAKQDSKLIKITKATPDYEVLRPLFGSLFMDIIKKPSKILHNMQEDP